MVLWLITGIHASTLAQLAQYRNGNNSWEPDSLGNIRAVINVPEAASCAMVRIPWRRHDDPQGKDIIVVDAKSNKKIENYKLTDVSRESGTVYFEPRSGAGRYYIYFMPYQVKGRPNYPNVVYLDRAAGSPASWTPPPGKSQMAMLQYIESINAFNSVFPMEVVANTKEVHNLLVKHRGDKYLVFPEDRTYPIRMKNNLPQRWITTHNNGTFSGKALRGEHYSYQLGIYAVSDEMKNVGITFSSLKTTNGHEIPASAFSCLNTSGTRYDGSPFTAKVNIPAGQVQAIWCLANIPQSATAGLYTGTVKIRADNAAEKIIRISISIGKELAADGNISQPQLQTRLHWLNSTLAQKNEVIAPYIPLEIANKTISLLGRKLELNASGFPQQIQTFFSQEMTSLQDSANNLLGENIHFHIVNAKNNKDIPFTTGNFRFTEKTPGTVSWTAQNTSTSLTMDVKGSIEFDGYVNYTVKIKAHEDINLKDIKLHIPYSKSTSQYLMGLGHKGGLRPDTINWKWDVAHKNQDGAWIGNINAGLQYSLRDEHYSRPLNTNFYLQKPLILPSSWGNDGKGGISIGVKGRTMLSENYSGSRSMKKGDELYYNFTLLITPFHTLNTDFQWQTRFYHKYENIDTIKKDGATLINIHHANPINPYINYPFIKWKSMKSYIDSAHSAGLKVKIYNTVRELSNRAYETFPMRSLGHEIYSQGPGGGYSWLQEHIGDDYIAAWYVPGIKDAAIVNSGMSRWHNYYVEGMNWLVNNVGIDGIYLDDVAFDRITMKRVKRVMTANGHPGIIDLHSANQYNKSDGFNNSANLYLEHFPYINRLWFGEYFDYEKSSPDFFLTEVSGIPFGLMGEMLQDGGNAWRGMIYGMTNRMPWSNGADPRPIWKIWDKFGMTGSKMIGYWVTDNPVKTDNPAVLATIYTQKGKTMIALASWAHDDVKVKLKIDWKALGLDPERVTLYAPEIKNVQTEATFMLGNEIPVSKNKGIVLIAQ